MNSRRPSDDPFGDLARDAAAHAQGLDPGVAALGDTDHAIRRAPQAITEQTASSEILTLVEVTLAAEPERADLWMMRFDIQKALGLRDEFAAGLREAWAHPRLSRKLDWVALATQWHQLAPDLPPPEGVSLPAPNRGPAAGPASAPAVTELALQMAPETVPQNRRFADLAQTLAGRELAVLGKAYAALRARPGFFEDYWRKVAPLLRRPTALQFSSGLSALGGGAARIFLKREDRRPVTPEHENAAAHCYVALSLGKTAVVSGSDVAEHALALAGMARLFKLRCLIVLRSGGDAAARAALAAQLRQLGAEIRDMPPEAASDDPREGALRLWRADLSNLFLALSPGTGPNPYPTLLANFRALLGHETARQLRDVADGRPQTLVAAVQSEADSIGFMLAHLADRAVELFYAEPEPGGPKAWRSSRRLRNYNGALREHVWLRDLGRIQHVAISDDQGHTGRQQLASSDSVAVGLEDGRAVSLALLLTRRASSQKRDYIVLVGG